MEAVGAARVVLAAAGAVGVAALLEAAAARALLVAGADLAEAVNNSVENIGARRLQTILEKVCEEISYTASDRSGESLAIDADYVSDRVGGLARNSDLSKFIL